MAIPLDQPAGERVIYELCTRGLPYLVCRPKFVLQFINSVSQCVTLHPSEACIEQERSNTQVFSTQNKRLYVLLEYFEENVATTAAEEQNF